MIKKSLLLLSCISTSSFSESFEYKDWEITCDNTRTCHAVGYSKNEGKQLMSVFFTRLAGKNQAVTGKLLVSGMEYAPVTNTYLSINGKKLRDLIFSDDGILLRNSDTQAILDAVRGLGKVQIISTQQVFTLSNEGANAVLLKMDDIQGRVGTTSALIKKGSKTQVLPALPKLIVKSKPIIIDFKGLKLDTQAFKDEVFPQVKNKCNAFEENQPSIGGILSKNKILVAMFCWNDQYNHGVGYWVANKQKPYQPQMITLDGSYREGNSISSYQIKQGKSDCLSFKIWVWDGTHFVQTSNWTSGMCRAIQAGGRWGLRSIVSKVD